MTDANQYIEALEFERLGYERRELPERVKEVDEQIKIWTKIAAKQRKAAADETDEAPADAEPAPDQVTTEAPKPRSRR